MAAFGYAEGCVPWSQETLDSQDRTIHITYHIFFSTLHNNLITYKYDDMLQMLHIMNHVNRLLFEMKSLNR